MTIWQIIGIEPTRDITQIKRAYAQQLKVHHPEDDPQGYQRLREAYERALKLVKQPEVLVEAEEAEEDDYEEDYENDDSDDEYWEEDTDEDEFENEARFPRRNSQEPYGNYPDYSSIEIFMDEVEALYSNFYARINIERWTVLLSADVVWNVKLKPILSDRMLEFLQENDQLPLSVWKLLESNFCWIERSREELYYADNLPSILSESISGQSNEHSLRFNFFTEGLEIDFDAYLRLRKEVFQALQQNELASAGQNIELAYAIYPNDPDLLRMQGEYYLRMGQPELALAAFSRGIVIHPADLDGYLYRVHIWYDQGQFSKAIPEIKFILEQRPDNSDIRCLLGQCYLNTLETKQAIQVFEQILNGDPNDVKATFYLIESRLQLVKTIQKQPATADNSELKQLRRQLGNSSFKERSQRMFKFIPQYQLIFYLTLILSIHTFIIPADSRMNQLNEGSSEPVQIEFMLTEASFLGLYEFKQVDENGKEQIVYTSDLSQAKQENKYTSDTPFGWLYTGYMQADLRVIVVADAKQANILNKEKAIQVTGKIYEITSQPLADLVVEKLQLPSLAPYKDVTLIDGQYIDARMVDSVVVAEQPITEPLVVENETQHPFTFKPYMLMLMLLYVSLIRVLVKGYRAARF